MKVFLDTNIIIDFYDKRGEFSRDLLIMCRLQMNSWKQFSLTNRKARQDFDGLGELFLFLFPESGSIYFFMLLGLVAAETIGEGEAYDSAKVHVVDDVLTSVGVVQMIVACLEDVVAVGFQLELVILERLPGEGSVEIA